MKRHIISFSVMSIVIFINIFLLSTTYGQFNMTNTFRVPFITSANNQISSINTINIFEKDIIFIENIGQIKNTKRNNRADVLFHTRSQGVDMYITSSGLTFVFRKSEGEIKTKDVKANYHRLDIEFIGANKNFNVKKEQACEHKINYFTSEYQNGISPKGYRKITIENLYNGIDLVYYEKEGKLKYDFIIKKGTDAGKIRMKYIGASSVFLDIDGNLKVTTPMGEIREERPYTYSKVTGVKIESSYKIEGNVVRFNVFEHDKSEDIVIDPIRIWATYYGGLYGGSGMDQGTSITTDGNNNILVAGYTHCIDFPLQNPGGSVYFQGTNAGYSDTFILKFNSNGVREWATYYGGSSYDYGYSITADGNNNILVNGYTNSSDFPVYNPGGGAYFQGTKAGLIDIFLLKFNSNGERLWATYYGGSNDDYVRSINSDINNNVLVTGFTNSTNLPTYNPGGSAYFQGTNAGYSDIFILKFDSNGVIHWATYYGGGANDMGESIATDENNNILLTGNTSTYSFPLQDPGGGAYFQSIYGGEVNDVFILKFDSSGARFWATFYGGNNKELGHSIYADENNNIMVTGEVRSTDFPVYNPGGGAFFQGTHAGMYWDKDLFILKFNSNGVRQWATYYGGDDWDIGSSITTDGNNNILLTGGTYSTNFPLLDPGGSSYFQGSHGGGNYDVFILEFNTNGVRRCATFYGGTSSEYGNSITTDGNNNILLTGGTYSTNFPLLDPGGGAYFQSIYGGGSYDAFILKFNPTPVGIKNISNEIPAKYCLYQNYPNPFNNQTVIEFDINKSSDVKLKVYNLLSKEVNEIVNSKLSAGSYKFKFIGSELSSGIYFYRLLADGIVIDTKKMLLIK